MTWKLVGVVAALGAAGLVGVEIAAQEAATTPTYPQGQTMPWGQTSDQIAWLTFAQIVAPSGAPNVKAAEFETWASDQDIYRTNPVWPALGTAKKLQMSALGRAGLTHGAPRTRGALIVSPNGCSPPGGMPPQGTAGIGSGYPAGACVGEEVRRNWASYQYIVRNNLYTQAGMAKAFANAGLTVSLPSDAVEFKGDWVPVATLKTWLGLTDAQVAQEYYVNSATAGGVTTSYALVSFHFSTKQQGNWVWSDFEHERNPGRCDTIGCHDSYGAATANVQPNAKPWQQYGACAKTPQVAALLGAAQLDRVWNHYCLKGSQVTFTQPDGKTPVLLGNSMIEAIAADVPIAQSSCQTCHAVASFDKNGQPNFNALGQSPIGNVDPKLMTGYKSADFLWGILFAPSGSSAKARRN
ncbi:hypothetical protein [Sphingomonas hylomeconis]|uniref:Cytochrome c family protein n=1 Tax=Sphingomonas hylomeconis TaxID=1395958 RepID=A0ABV7SXH9_9SPHN|nr:hypothetical protein [Sphingomonas hylomeconis]